MAESNFVAKLQCFRSKSCMKILLILSLGVLLGTSGCVVGPPAPPPAGGGFVVAVEDRPYYVRGPYYLEHGRRYVWINGHWARRHGRRVWVHGHYVLRG
jgi:WXXGXW repeat (2 copies)